MAHFKTILTATDFSSASALAVDRAFFIAATHQARCHVINALGADLSLSLQAIKSAAINAEALSAQILAQTQKELDEFIADCPHHEGVQIERTIQDQSADYSVPLYAEKIDADLLVIGAQGKGFLQRVLIGSTATRLLRKTHCPTLVVKQPCHRDYRRALVAVDFSRISKKNIELAQHLAPGAHLVLAHAYEVPFEGRMQMAGVSEDLMKTYREEARVQAISRLDDLAQQAGLAPDQFTAIATYGSAVKELLQIEQQHRCDLIVLGKHGTNATAELLLGSVTKRVLADCQSDLLVSTDASHKPVI
jgi:nucleotide-binding universal stress UspA family protein